MNIESQHNRNCVGRAFSTMRIVLGYKTGILPIKLHPDRRNVSDIVKIVGDVFPRNEVYVWCAESNFVSEGTNVFYCGTEYAEDFDDTKYIIAFAYYDSDKDDACGHMVIGSPQAYNNFLGLVIAVKEVCNEKET